MNRKGTSSVVWLAVLVIVLYGFVIWLQMRTANETMGFMEGVTEQYVVEKGKYFIAMFKESYETPALTFSLMKVVKDLGMHGGITKKFIDTHGVLTDSEGKNYVRNVKVDVDGAERGCMRVEKETSGIWPFIQDEYVLYWVQAEGTSIDKFRPYGYYSDENVPIKKDTPYIIKFETDHDRPVKEVAIVLYFLKDGWVDIYTAGGSMWRKRVDRTGVYILTGGQIVNNEIRLIGSEDNVAVLRGVVASIYKDVLSSGGVATCARDMLEDLMWEYIRPVLRSESYYGIQVINTYPNVSFDPSTYYIHGSTWMPQGANLTKYFGDGRVMVRLHSNMFAENNISVRYGLLVEYANWFVENIEEVLIRKLMSQLNSDFDDYSHEDSGWHCGDVNCPDETDVSYSGSDFKLSIQNALEDLSDELTHASKEGIEWKLELVDFNSGFTTNSDKSVCEDGSLCIDYEEYPNFIHMERQVIIWHTGGECDCWTGPCGGHTCDHYRHRCEVKYYHRYVLKDLKIKVTIKDTKFKIYDKDAGWVPVTLVFYVNVNVDDNLCNGDKVCSGTSDTRTSYGGSIPSFTDQSTEVISITLPS